MKIHPWSKIRPSRHPFPTSSAARLRWWPLLALTATLTPLSARIEHRAYVKASNTEAADIFGQAVAISGDTMVIGAPGEDGGIPGVNGNQADNGAPGSGAVHLFRRSGGNWARHAYLKASNADANDQFGLALAVSGGTAVVGAHLEDGFATGVNGNHLDNTATAAGAAYVFNVEGPFAEITAASRSGHAYITEFAGPPGLTEWKVMGSTDLNHFDIDKTPATTFVEFAAGKYRAVTDLSGAGPHFFLRIEHE